MNEVELGELEQRPEFRANVKAALRHWGNYWRVESPEEVAALSEKARVLCKAMIKFIFDDPARATDTVASMVIADATIKAQTCYHAVTYEKVKAVVDSLLGKDVSWFVPEGYVILVKQEEAGANAAGNGESGG